MSSPKSDKKSLRQGYTTGACAAAATLGAALLLRDGRLDSGVDLFLPAGFSHRFDVQGARTEGESARCFVVKDAGDDPDVTDGVEVHAEVAWKSGPPADADGHGTIVLQGGVGIGRVTKPGLAVAVGEWAINPVPRRMILDALRSVFPDRPEGRDLVVTLSIPDGEERSKRTLNQRLGIIGGLSILGTTGIVRPISHKAWTDTLEVALDVALAAGCPAVVLSTGRTSESAAQELLSPSGLAEEAYIMMGDHVGYALDACHRKGVGQIVLAVQFAKLVKIACGHPQTHVSSSRLDLVQLGRWAGESGLDAGTVKAIECANTAREVYMQFSGTGLLVDRVAREALQQCRNRIGTCGLKILLVGYDDRHQQWFGTGPIGPSGEDGI